MDNNPTWAWREHCGRGAGAPLIHVTFYELGGLLAFYWLVGCELVLEGEQLPLISGTM